jgi:hypothetical protein
MVWARLKVLNSDGKPFAGEKVGRERLFNLDQLQWWIGFGHYVVLQYASHDPIYVDIADKQMEFLTGSSGGYAGTP